jgi:uncharacterized protein YdeI (BOF family)
MCALGSQRDAKLALHDFCKCTFAASPAAAQFVGPAVTGEEMTVEAARSAAVDSCVTVTGSIASHLRDEAIEEDQTS